MQKPCRKAKAPTQVTHAFGQQAALSGGSSTTPKCLLWALVPWAEGRGRRGNSVHSAAVSFYQTSGKPARCDALG